MSGPVPPASPSTAAPVGRGPVRLHVLGGFALAGCGGLEPGPAAQRLVAFVALARRPVPREVVAGTLWCEAGAQRAAGRLRTTLWRLPRPEGRVLVEATATHVRLGHAVQVDLHGAQDDAQHVLRTGSAVEDIAPFLTDLLPDWWDDWLVGARESYRQLRLHALECLSVLYRDAGRFQEALAVALQCVASEPHRDSAHRCVIEAHLAEGNPTEAVRHYEMYVRQLRRETGLAPSAALHQQVAGLIAARPRTRRRG